VPPRSRFSVWSTGLRAFRSAGGVAILAGSGVSVTSGLPTAWEFNEEFKAFLASNQDENRLLASALPFGYRKAGVRQPVRFEQLLQMLRDLADPQLRILRCYDEPVAPGYLHRLLALCLSRSCPVFTTNFDSLIEAAYHAQYGTDLQQIHVERAFPEERRRPAQSFERFVKREMPMPAILKLHGTIRVVREDGTFKTRHSLSHPSIGATLDNLGGQRSIEGLEHFKDKAFGALLAGRWLCVIGYSGSDDLDVLPSLRRAVRRAKGILWVRHTSGKDITITFGTTPDGKALIPSQLHEAADSIPCAIIEGPTEAIMSKLTGIKAEKDAAFTPSASRQEVVRKVLSLAPYLDLTPAQRKQLVARTMEMAEDRGGAYKLYAAAAALAAKGEEHGTRAYALGRLGHLERLRGEMPLALRHLKEARRIYNRIHRQERVAFITTSIGNVYLNQGKLGMALREYQNAYRLNARYKTPASRAARATNIGNIGIIYRKQGLFRKAISMYRKAFRINRGLRNKEGMVRDLGNIGVSLLNLRRYPEAASYLTQSLSLAREIGRLETVSIQLLNLAVVQRHLGDLSKSSVLSKEAIALERQLGRKEGVAECLSNIGSIHEARGDRQKALHSYRDALGIERQIGDLEGVAVELENIGRTLLSLGRPQESLDTWRDCLTVYRRIGNKAKSLEITSTLGAVKAREKTPLKRKP
jgi:tetratricopeptide (TPR) repeat protein/NAD-dependent SIR2 family protein deacetylase